MWLDADTVLSATDALVGSLTQSQFDEVTNMLIDFNAPDLAMTTDSPAFMQMSNALSASNQFPDVLIIQTIGSSAPIANSKLDKATLNLGFDGLGDNATVNLADWACGFLTRENVAGWNEKVKCHFIAFLNNPTHGTLTSTGNEGQFTYKPQQLGKDVIRFIVKNDDGRKAIVTWNIEIVEYGSKLNADGTIQTASSVDDANATSISHDIDNAIDRSYEASWESYMQWPIQFSFAQNITLRFAPLDTTAAGYGWRINASRQAPSPAKIQTDPRT